MRYEFGSFPEVFAALAARPEFRRRVGRWIKRVAKDPFDPQLGALCVAVHDRALFQEVGIERAPFVAVLSVDTEADDSGIGWIRVVNVAVVPDLEAHISA